MDSMETNLEDIKKTAKLAKFNITEQEAELYTKQMSAVLDWVAQLQAVDTSASSPDNSEAAPLREDAPRLYEYTGKIIAAFNDKDGENLKVKKVL